MRKNLSKFGISMLATVAAVGGILLAGAQDAPVVDMNQVPVQDIQNAQAVDPTLYEGRAYGMMNKDSKGNWSMSGNFRNLEDNSHSYSMLKNIFPALAVGLIGAGIILTILAILILAFWIWMLVDAIRRDIDYKPVWILVIGVLGIIGAIAYYFAVKKNPDYCCGEECHCEDGVCATCDGKDCKCEVK